MNVQLKRWAFAALCLICVCELTGIHDPVTDFLLGGSAAMHLYITLLAYPLFGWLPYAPYLGRESFYDFGFSFGMFLPFATILMVPYTYILERQNRPRR